jgi:outer membrane protein OmpA-like peptidoglycan-associated protein
VAPPGQTTYFGMSPPRPDLPVVKNEAYRPVTAAPTPSAPVAPAPPAAAATARAAPPLTPPASPAAPARAAAATLDLAQCRAAIAGATSGNPIRFESGRVRLTPETVAALGRVADTFRTCADGRLRIEGHTDDVGPAAANLRLSERRAQAVAGFMRARGVPARRLSAEGFGLTRPIVANTDEAARAKNRRIDFAVE